MKKKNIDLSFLNPTYEEIELPSKGLLYEGGLSNGKIHVRSMLTAEEKLFDRINKANFNDIIDQIIQRCTQEDIDVNSLTLGDKLFLLYWIRVKTYGPEYTVRIRCDNCGEENNFNISLSEFDIKYLNETITEEELSKGIEPIEVVLPETKIKVKIHIPRNRDFKEATSISYVQMKKKGVALDPIFYQKLLCIDEIVLPNETGDILTQKEDFNLIIEIFEKLPSKDNLYIDKVLKKYDHGIVDPIYKPCNYCGELIEIYPVLNIEFFRPSV